MAPSTTPVAVSCTTLAPDEAWAMPAASTSRTPTSVTVRASRRRRCGDVRLMGPPSVSHRVRPRVPCRSARPGGHSVRASKTRRLHVSSRSRTAATSAVVGEGALELVRLPDGDRAARPRRRRRRSRRGPRPTAVVSSLSRPTGAYAGSKSATSSSPHSRAKAAVDVDVARVEVTARRRSTSGRGGARPRRPASCASGTSARRPAARGTGSPACSVGSSSASPRRMKKPSRATTSSSVHAAARTPSQPSPGTSAARGTTRTCSSGLPIGSGRLPGAPSRPRAAPAWRPRQGRPAPRAGSIHSSMRSR